MCCNITLIEYISEGLEERVWQNNTKAGYIVTMDTLGGSGGVGAGVAV